MKGWERLVGTVLAIAIIAYGGYEIVGWTIRIDDPKPTPPTLTPQDVLLALEAHEAKCKCGNDDEFAKQFAKTLEGSGIPRLPGVKE